MSAVVGSAGTTHGGQDRMPNIAVVIATLGRPDVVAATVKYLLASGPRTFSYSR
jgi:hypothetical protein